MLKIPFIDSNECRAFVTGGSGYVGGALVKSLLENGWKVNALVNQSHGCLDGMNVNIIQGNLFEKDHLLKGMEGCEVVFHLAAKISFSPADHKELMETNRNGTEMVLECALQSKVKSTVVTSSACTMGIHPEPFPVDESTPCRSEWRKRNLYLDSKRAQEEVCLEFHKKGLRVVAVNPTTIFGPGDRSLNSGAFFKQVLHQPFTLVPPGGTSVVDVEDIAQGIIAAARFGKSGHRYILTSENLTFKEIYQCIALYHNGRSRLVSVPPWTRSLLKMAASLFCLCQSLRGVDESQLTPQIIEDTFAYKWYSSAKAHEELGWNPAFSFKDSVKRSLLFYRKEGLL